MREQAQQNEELAKANRFKKYFQDKAAKIKAMKGKDWLNFFLNNAIIITLIIFFIVTAIMANAMYGINLFSLSHIFNIIELSSRAMFLALGIGGIIILTGTDLSAGRIVGFTAVVAAGLLQIRETATSIFKGITPIPIFVVFIIVILIGGIFGAINGFFVAKFKLHPFIVTLATGLMIFGFGSIVAGSKSIVEKTIPAYGNFYEAGMVIFGRKIGFFVLIAMAAVMLTWFLWHHTKFGKNMYAVGSNPEAANISSVNVNLAIILVFMYAGLLYGISGFLEGSVTGSANASAASTTGKGAELYAIAACVIGGVSFSGGVGKIRGVIIGVLILTCLKYGLEKINFSGDQSNLFTGAVILFAVTLDMRKYLVKR